MWYSSTKAARFSAVKRYIPALVSDIQTFGQNIGKLTYSFHLPSSPLLYDNRKDNSVLLRLRAAIWLRAFDTGIAQLYKRRTAVNRLLAYDPRNPAQAIHRIWVFSAVYTILFGLFACGNPLHALQGLWQIFCSPCALITDYIVVGGIDGAFLNAGLAMLFSALYTKWVGAPIGGLGIAVGYIVAGFALFGKTLPNMFPILIGGWLYARYRREPFANHIYTSMFATCMGPLVHHAG